MNNLKYLIISGICIGLGVSFLIPRQYYIPIGMVMIFIGSIILLIDIFED